MKVFVVSDTHGKRDLYLALCLRYGPFDMVIHCGDIEDDEDIYSEAAGCPIKVVAGNNDFFLDCPRDDEFTLCGYKIWLTHGHHYCVSMSTQILKDEARSRGIDIVFYGHTHKPVIDCDDGLYVVNPGSLTYPRQEGRRPSYIVMDIEEGKVDFKINYLS